MDKMNEKLQTRLWLRRGLALVLALLMVVTSVTWPENREAVKATTTGVSDCASFWSAIANANDGDIINVNSDITIGNGNAQTLKSNCTVTVNLNGHTLTTAGSANNKEFGIGSNSVLLFQNGTMQNLDTTAESAGIVILNGVTVTGTVWLGKTTAWVVNNSSIANLETENGQVNPGASDLNPKTTKYTGAYSYANSAPAMVGSGTTWSCLGTLQADFDLAASNSSTYSKIILLKNYSLTGNSALSAAGITVDLSGYTLTTGSYTLGISNTSGTDTLRNGTISGNLSLTSGSGNVVLTGMTVTGTITNASHPVTINGGHYANISGGTGKVTITDGYYSGTLSGSYYAINGGYFVNEPAFAYLASGYDAISTSVIEGGKTYNYKVGTHTHSWTYSASGAVLTATCSTGACRVTNTVKTFTLSSVSQTYTGSAVSVTTNRSAWDTAGIAAPTITYYLSDGSTLTTADNSGSASNGAAPVYPGSYVVKAVAGSGSNTASAQTTITITFVSAPSGYVACLIPHTLNADGNAADTTRAYTGTYTYYPSGNTASSSTKSYNGLRVIVDGQVRYYYKTLDAAIEAAQAGTTDTTNYYNASSNPSGVIVEGTKGSYDTNDSLNGDIGLYTDTVMLLADGGTVYNIGSNTYMNGANTKYGIGKGIVLDLNGHTINLLCGGYIASGQNLIVKNGTIGSASNSKYADAYDDEGGTGTLTGTIVFSNVNILKGKLWSSNHSFIFLNSYYDITFGDNEKPTTVNPRGGYFTTNPTTLGVALDYSDCHIEDLSASPVTANGLTYYYKVVKGPTTYSIKVNANPVNNASTVKINDATYSDNCYTLPGTVEYGQSVSLPTITCYGYELASWNTKADGSGTSYAVGSNVSDLTKVNGATVTLYAIWTHKHEWAYKADGNMLYAYCVSSSSCTYYGTESSVPTTVSLTLNAADTVYNGQPVTASLTKSTNWTTLSLTEPTIQYYLSDGTTLTTSANSGAASEGAAPVNVGSYTAKITVGGKTATKTFAITKADVSNVSNPTAKTGLVYTAGAQTLINGGSVTNGTFYYKLGNGEYSTTLPTATAAGTYTVYYKIVGDSNHKDVAESSLSVTIAKADQTIAAPTIAASDVTASTITVTAETAGFGTTTYAIGETDTAPTTGWTETLKFEHLTANHTYYVFAKYAGDDNHNGIVSAAVQVTTKAKNTVGSATLNVRGDGTCPELPYDGAATVLFDDILNADPVITGGTGTASSTYAYTGRLGTEYPSGCTDGSTTTATAPTDAGTYYLVITTEDEENILTTKVPFEITKLDQTKPSASDLTCYRETVDGVANGCISGLTADTLINAQTKYEYSVDGGSVWTLLAAGTVNITGLPDGEILLRKAGQTNYNASEALSLNLDAGLYLKLKDGENEWTWNSFLNTITFGRYFKNTQTVSVENYSNLKDIDSVSYYLTTEQKTTAELVALTADDWKTYSNMLKVKINPTDQYIVYFKIVDAADDPARSTHYISTDGIEVDADAPLITGIESNRKYIADETEGDISFTVSDLDLKSVITVDADGNETALTGSKVAGTWTYLLPIGNYTSITALDMCGNQTVLSDVKVIAGQKKPTLSQPEEENPSGGGGEEDEAPGYDDGPFTVKDSDGDPVIEFSYDPEEPGLVDITDIDPAYEIYLGPLDEDGNPTVGPIDGASPEVESGTTIYIRKKATTDPEQGPSDFVPYTIPDAAAATVYAGVYTAGSGTASISGTSENPEVVYVGKSVTLTATAADGYSFSRWVDKTNGGTLSTDSTYTFTVTEDGEVYNYAAVFDMEGSKVVSVPTFRRSFTYDGNEKIALSIDDLPDHTSVVKPGSTTGAVNVGIYTYTLKLENGYTWGDGTTANKTITWHIDPASTEKPAVIYTPGTNPTIDVSNIPEGRKVEYKWESEGSICTANQDGSTDCVLYPTANGQINSDSNYVLPGTYYVRVMADDNHQASAWVPVAVYYKNPVISSDTPTDFTPGTEDPSDPTGESSSTVTTHSRLETTDNVKRIVVRYRKQGETEWNEIELPVSTVIDYTFGENETLEDDAVYEYQTVVTMEGPADIEEDDYSIEGKIQSFKAPASSENGGIGGNDGNGDKGPGTGKIAAGIVNDSSETRTIILSIEEGNTVIASKSISIAPGTIASTTAFTGLNDGTYNIVLRSSDGKLIETRMVTIKNGTTENVDYTLKEGCLQSLVDIINHDADGNTIDTPNVAVGGLPEVITDEEEAAAASGSMSVSVQLEVEKKAEEAASGADALEAILPVSGRQLDMFLDMSLYKTTTNFDASGNETDTSTSDIGLSNRTVMEIAVPYDTVNNVNIGVVRYHDFEATYLAALSARPADHFVDGTFYVGDGVVFVYACAFSTYAFTSDSAEKTAFRTYQQEKEDEADSLEKDTDSDISKALIKAAREAIAALTYDESKTLEENKAAVDRILAQLKLDLDAQRTKEANHAAFEEYKQELKETIEGLRKKGDSAACRQLIDKALAELEALTYDDSKSLEENKALADSILTLLKSQLTEQRKKDGAKATPPKTDDPGNAGASGSSAMQTDMWLEEEEEKKKFE